MVPTAPLRVSVAIVTYRRAAFVEESLAHLHRLHTAPDQIVVVDASPDSATREIVAGYPHVVYLRNEAGGGTTAESRQIALGAMTSDIVAFLDDDAYVAEDWLDRLVEAYHDPTVDGVGGRVDNGIPGEDTQGLGHIGKLLPDGTLTGNFAANPGRRIDVHHMLGANHSYRRASLLAIGGFRGNYPGTCLREETDPCLRLFARGGRMIFDPSILVRHVAAPYGNGGKRFDRRYLYYARRNHVMLLARVFGWRSPYIPRYYVAALRDQKQFWVTPAKVLVLGIDSDGNRVPLRRRLKAPITVTRSFIELAGLVAGISAGVNGRRKDRRNGVGTPQLN